MCDTTPRSSGSSSVVIVQLYPKLSFKEKQQNVKHATFSKIVEHSNSWIDGSDYIRKEYILKSFLHVCQEKVKYSTQNFLSNILYLPRK